VDEGTNGRCFFTKEDLTDEKQSWIIADEQIQQALNSDEYLHLKKIFCTSYVNPFNNTLFIVLTNVSEVFTEQFIEIGAVKNRTIVSEYKTPISYNEKINITEYVVNTKIVEEKYAPVKLIFRKCNYNYEELLSYIKAIKRSKKDFDANEIIYSSIGMTVNGTILLTFDEITSINIKKVEAILDNKVPSDIVVIRKASNKQSTSFAGRTEEHDVLIGGLKITIPIGDGSYANEATLGFIARNLYEDEIGILTVNHFVVNGVGDEVFQPNNLTNPTKIGDVDVIWNTTTDASWIGIDNRDYMSKIYNITSDQVIVDEECRDNSSIRIGQPVWYNGAKNETENWGTVSDLSWDYQDRVWVGVDCVAGQAPVKGDSGAPVYRKRYDTYADVWRAEPIGIQVYSDLVYKNEWWFTSLDIVEQESGDRFNYRLDRDFSEFTHQGSSSFAYSDYYQDNHLTTVTCNEDTWDYENKGAGYFDDWYAEVTVDADSHGTRSGGAFLFALSNEVNDWQDIDDGIGLYLTWAQGAGEWRLILKTRQNGDTTDADTYVTNTAEKRVVLEKDGTDVYAYIFGNTNRTVYLDTLHVTMDSDQSYRYVYSVMSNDSDKTAAYLTGDVTEFAYWTKDNK